MKKLLLFLCIGCLLSPILFANGGSESAAEDKGVELTFFEVMTNPARTGLIKEMIAEYEGKTPGTTITLISPPYEQADNKLTIMMNAKQDLDVIEVRDKTIKQYVNNDYLLDLEPYIAKSEFSKTLLPLSLSSGRSVDDTAYMIPSFFYITALFLRTDILEANGYTEADYPKTLDDMYQLCIDITDPASNQYGLTLRGKSGTMPDQILYSDVPDHNIAAGYKTASGGSVFLHPEYLRNLKSLKNAFDKSVPSDGINWGFNEQLNAFVSGITPVLLQDPDAVGVIDQQLTRDQYTVIPMPVSRNGTYSSLAGFAGIGIPSYTEQKDEAWDFVEFFLSSEQNSKLCKFYGALPVHSTTYEQDNYFSEGVYKAWATIMSTPDVYKFHKGNSAHEKAPAWGKIFEADMQAVYLDAMTPEDAVKKWAAYWE